MPSPFPPPIVEFDSASEPFQNDPYPTYAALRAREPMAYREPGTYRAIWFTRHADVTAILRDPRFHPQQGPDELNGPGIPERFRRFGEILRDMMLLKSGADHARLRGLVNKAFTPRRVAGLETRIEAITAKLLDDVDARGDGRSDLIADLATPLPVLVIADLLGIPAEDQPRFKHWSDKIAVVLDGSIRAAGIVEAADAAAELSEYLRAVVDERRAEPRDDLLSALAAARDEDDALSDDELVANAILLLAAGHETTTNLIGHGVLALLRHPDELARLQSDPELAPLAVEEALRFDPPVQLTARTPSEPVVWHDHVIEPGVECTLSIGAANRDEEVFDDPERFRIDRKPGRLLSFGHGAHFCVGAPLARLEGTVAFRQVAARWPELALAEEPPRRPGLVLRGLAALPVATR